MTQPATTCDCGDPNCVYVANLDTALAWMRQATAPFRPENTEETER